MTCMSALNPFVRDGWLIGTIATEPSVTSRNNGGAPPRGLSHWGRITVTVLSGELQ